MKEWLDKCVSHDLSDSVEDCEQFISKHEELREAYQSAYGLAMKDGQQLREGLMNHIGVAKGNTPSHSTLSVHLQRVQVTIVILIRNKIFVFHPLLFLCHVIHGKITIMYEFLCLTLGQKFILLLDIG